MEAAGGNRHGHRDATMALVACWHGLRAGLQNATLHVRRVKQGTPGTHPILGDELRALRRLQREQEPRSPFVFTSERGAPFTTAGFARMIERAGGEARSRPTRTCSGAPAGTHLPTRDTTRAPCKPTLAPQHPAHGEIHRVEPDEV
jgi:integrase